MSESDLVRPEGSEPAASRRGASLGSAEGAPASRPLRALRDPALVILILAGTFDGLSGNPIHSTVLFAAALALARNAAIGAPRTPAPRPRAAIPSRLGPIALAAAGAYALIVGGFARYSWPATVAVVVVAAGVLRFAWHGPAHASRPDKPDLRGMLAWASVFVALALWELTQLLLQPSLTTDSRSHPTLSVLTDPVLATHPGRSIALTVWLAFGWFLVKR